MTFLDKLFYREMYCTHESFVGLDIIALSISIWLRFTTSWMIARMTGNKMMKRSTMTSSVTTIDVIMTQRRLYRGTRCCWTCGSSSELFRSPAPVLSMTPGTLAAVAVMNPAGCIACSNDTLMGCIKRYPSVYPLTQRQTKNYVGCHGWRRKSHCFALRDLPSYPTEKPSGREKAQKKKQSA